MTYVKMYIQEISFKGIEYGLIFGALLLAVLLFLHVRKRYPVWRIVVAMALYAFLFVVFASTVFSRPDYGVYDYNLELFWSYRAAREQHSQFLAVQILINMLVLIPVGVLFPLAMSRAHFVHTFFFGLFCSGMIEVLQLVLQRGLFEWDDILHNVLGVCAGYGLFWIIRCIYKHRTNE